VFILLDVCWLFVHLWWSSNRDFPARKMIFSSARKIRRYHIIIGIWRWAVEKIFYISLRQIQRPALFSNKTPNHRCPPECNNASSRFLGLKKSSFCRKRINQKRFLTTDIGLDRNFRLKQMEFHLHEHTSIRQKKNVFHFFLQKTTQHNTCMIYTKAESLFFSLISIVLRSLTR
jgi:hypothetical protein